MSGLHPHAVIDEVGKIALNPCVASLVSRNRRPGYAVGWVAADSANLTKGWFADPLGQPPVTGWPEVVQPDHRRRRVLLGGGVQGGDTGQQRL
jgi:hypothetical protein